MYSGGEDDLGVFVAWRMEGSVMKFDVGLDLIIMEREMGSPSVSRGEAGYKSMDCGDEY